jgi:membrane fusion protein (multidrug efflux system)
MVVRVHINDNQHVAAGTPLLEIFQDDYIHTVQERKEALSRLAAETREIQATIEEKKKVLAQAQANLNAVTAEGSLAAKEIKRYDKLHRQEVVSTSQYDRVESAWKVAEARKEAAMAAVVEAEAAVKALQAKSVTQEFKIKETEVSRNQAQLDLTRTTIVAPISGRIAMKNVDPGKYVQPGQALLSIVQDDTWVIANFKETQIKKMAIGQPVDVKVDAYPGMTFRGCIDSLQSGTGAVFSLLPPENATGNFVKVVQRIPVKIVMESPFDPVHPLWPGMSVEPSVDVSHETGPKLAGK